MAINEEQQLGRAKNAVLSYFEQRLSVPKIYIDAQWDGINGHPINVDVLAINRDGVGDVYAVLLFPSKYGEDGSVILTSEIEDVRRLIETFNDLPANFKYVGAVGKGSGRLNGPFRLVGKTLEDSFSPDGIGRIGLLSIDVLKDDVSVNLEGKPERFRAKIAKLADDYIQQHEADWEIRA